MTLSSLTLLQGAFSHNGFSADRKGAFKAVIGRVSGPISITHTHNDKACFGIYAYATRLSGDTTQAVGGPNDKFGAIGANGAQGLTVNTITAHEIFEPASGEVNNFLADRYISDHGDVRNAKVGVLLAATIQASSPS